MINFFRKTRKQLAAENKVVKYLRYSIGEIILVVIGILIALSINNWNEARKQEHLKQRLYIELYESIKSDTVDYNDDLKDLKSVVLNVKLLKEKIKLDEPYTPGLDTSLAIIGLIRSNEANYTILTRISNVGIEIIDNANLKNEFIHYYEDSKNFVQYAKKPNDLLEKIYPKYFISHIPRQSAIPQNFEELKKVNEFKIALDYCLVASEELLERTSHRKELALGILKMLDIEIKIPKDQLQKSPYVKLMKSDTLDIAN